MIEEQDSTVVNISETIFDIPNKDNTTTSEDNKQDKQDKQEESTVKYNAIESEVWSTPKTDYSKFNYTFSLPSIDLKTFSTRISNFNKLGLDEKSPVLKEWKKVNEEAVDYYTTAGLYQDRFTDPTSEFKQGIENEEGKLNSISNIKFKKTDGELKGELALLKVSKLLGLGDIMSVPLPHSGIWVTIKPPTERDLIDFYNTLFREKIVLGRTTSGLTLSNFSVYINDRLVDFIIKHIYSVNYSDIPKEELKNYILIHDLPILAWGFACTIYPNGFDFQRACVTDIEQCTYIAKAIINMTKLLWIDNSSLSKAQKTILEEYRPNKLTLDNYRKYIAEHTRVVSSIVTLKGDIKVKLKIPTINEYVTDGLNWINKINSAIEYVVIDNDNKEEEAKTELLNQYVKSSILRQYSHFIDYIEIEDNIIQDRDTINQVLEALSSDDEIRPELLNKVFEFKSKTTIALIGIPEYKCPNCGTVQKGDVNSNLTNVIPLDTMNLFFTLITLRIAKILEREV